MQPVFYSPRVIVLDCGARRTALGVFRRKGGRLWLEKYANRVFKESTQNDANWLDNTSEAFRAFRKLFRRGGEVVLVPPAQAVLTKLVRCPRVRPDQREKVIRFEAEQNIPYALADVVWDSVAIGESDTGIEVFLAAIKGDLVGPLCSAAEATGFRPKLVLPSLLGTLGAFRLAKPDLTESSLILNLRGKSADLLLAEPGRFAGRTFPLSGSGSVPATDGETSSSSSGKAAAVLTAQDAGLTVPAVEELGARLGKEIIRSVLHICSQTGMRKPVHLILTGDGAQMPRLPEVLAAELEITVERLDLALVVETALCVAANNRKEQLPLITEMVGAAATQLCPGQLVLNLLPARQRRVIQFRRRQPWLIAAAVLMLAAPVPPLIHFRGLRAVAQAKATRLEATLAPLRRRAAKAQAINQRLEEVRHQSAVLQGAYERRDRWIGLLADLENRLNGVGNVWIEKMEVTSEGKGSSQRLLLSGSMADKANPLSRASPEALARVKRLLAEIAGSPFVGAVEAPRFDNSQPGLLKFEFAFLSNPERPL